MWHVVKKIINYVYIQLHHLRLNDKLVFHNVVLLLDIVTE